jgi:hypothetical protein
MIHAEIRAIHNSVAFIQKAYRKKDPQYADFSIRQQQHLLTRLKEEWTRSECKEPLPTAKKEIGVPPRPKEAIGVRLVTRNCEKIQREIRATYDSIAFIEKTYREKDPDYADFSIRQQLHILERLDEEWAQSDCKEIPPSQKKKARR